MNPTCLAVIASASGDCETRPPCLCSGNALSVKQSCVIVDFAPTPRIHARDEVLPEIVSFVRYDEQSPSGKGNSSLSTSSTSLDSLSPSSLKQLGLSLEHSLSAADSDLTWSNFSSPAQTCRPGLSDSFVTI
mmetsp:Transcript_117828/g.214213  ORF Transcript_117828/g.214213 Transcript_117828/m.214213 type:complete len:132 (+) Transcript_117828:1-396(+)